MSNQIKYYSLNSLPNSAEIGAIYFLSNGSQFIGTSSNTFLPISEFIFTDTLPSIGILDKIYVHKEADKTSLKIWSGNSFELLSGEEFDDSAILQTISTLQNELTAVLGKVTTNEGKISTLENKVSNLEVVPPINLSPLETKINDIETELASHKAESVLDTDGSHGFKIVGDVIYVFENGDWRIVDVTESLIPHVENLQAHASATRSLNVTWENPTNPEFAKTLLYTSPNDISNVNSENLTTIANLVVEDDVTTEYTLEDVSHGETHYFKAVPVHNLFDSQYYGKAMTVSAEYIDTIPPANVTNVVITADDKKLVVTWDNPTDLDLANVRLHYSTSDNINSIDDGIVAYNGNGNSVEINNLINDTEYHLRFFAVDINGNINDSINMKYTGIPKTQGLKYYDTLTTIGASETLDEAAYNEAGYFGTVPASELFTGTDLALEVGITQGVVINDYSDWLKFYIDGKILFTVNKTVRHSINWNDINSAGCVYGSKYITKDNITFKVRLMKGAILDPARLDRTDKDAKGSEWNRLMLPIHTQASNKSWSNPEVVENDVPNWKIGFTDSDFGTINSTAGAGSFAWCQEKSKSNTAHAVTRGGTSVSSSGGSTLTNRYFHIGWRPVLEVVPPEELEGGN